MSALGSFSDKNQFSRRDAEAQRLLCFVSWSQHLCVSASLREFEFCKQDSAWLTQMLQLRATL